MTEKKWVTPPVVTFETTKEAYNKKEKDIVSIQPGGKPIPEQTILNNPINEKDILAEIDDTLKDIISIFDNGTPENERILLRENRFDKIAESKNITELAKVAAIRYNNGKWVRDHYQKNYNSIDCNFLYFFGEFCATFGEIMATAKYSDTLKKDLSARWRAKNTIKQTNADKGKLFNYNKLQTKVLQYVEKHKNDKYRSIDAAAKSLEDFPNFPSAQIIKREFKNELEPMRTPKKIKINTPKK